MILGNQPLAAPISTVTVSYSTYTNANVLKGKYWTGNNTAKELGLQYTPANAPNATRQAYSDYDVVRMQMADVTSRWKEEISEWEYLYSSSRSIYPDGGIVGGYEYQYLGVPYDNAVGAPKVETGSYVGTGTSRERKSQCTGIWLCAKVVADNRG